MAVFAAAVAFLTARNRAGRDFVPKAVQFNNYVAVMAVATLLLASLAAAWSVASLKVGNRRWTTTGFGLCVLFDLAALNLIWFLGKGVQLPVQGSEYAVVTYGVMAVAGIAIVIGALAAITGLVRVLGAQTSSSQPHLGMAAAWPQYLATLAWVAAWALIYLRK